MTNKPNNKKSSIPLDKKNQVGFTIIEVVLVLAIAGLIFLIVFLALPGLQRSRRDTQRKSDARRMLAAIINAESDGTILPPYLKVDSGSVPFASSAQGCNVGASPTCVIQTTDKFQDPSGQDYTIVSSGSLAGTDQWSSPVIGYIYGGVVGAKCVPGSGSDWHTYVASSTDKSSFGILMPLESGGYYCVDSTS